MGFYSGNSGSIQFGNANNVDGETGWRTTDTKVTNWTLSTSSQLLETTALGDYDKRSIYGLRTTSGTLKILYYIPDTSTNSFPNVNSASWFIDALQRAANQDLNSLPVRLRLYIDAKNFTGDLNRRDYVEFNANLTSVSYGSNVGEVVAVDASFEATGPVDINRL